MEKPDVQQIVDRLSSCIIKCGEMHISDWDYIFTDDGIDWRVIVSYDFTIGHPVEETCSGNGTSDIFYPDVEFRMGLTSIDHYDEDTDTWKQWRGDYRAIETAIKQTVLDLCR